MSWGLKPHRQKDIYPVRPYSITPLTQPVTSVNTWLIHNLFYGFSRMAEQFVCESGSQCIRRAHVNDWLDLLEVKIVHTLIIATSGANIGSTMKQNPFARGFLLVDEITYHFSLLWRQAWFSGRHGF